jgi:hypothetical protein
MSVRRHSGVSTQALRADAEAVRMAGVFVASSTIVVAVLAGASWLWPPVLWAFVVVGPLIGLGVADMVQTRQAIRRNFPLIGHGR